jgi:1,4-alpha-glucan branching enzyme
MKKSSGKAGRDVGFEVAAAPGSKVCVAGTFNNWNPTANPLKDNPDSGHFKTTIKLSPGRHEYKFIVNGEWRVDPKCSIRVPNGHGGLNSAIDV